MQPTQYIPLLGKEYTYTTPSSTPTLTLAHISLQITRRSRPLTTPASASAPFQPSAQEFKPRHPEAIEIQRFDRIRKNKKNYARPTRATSHSILIRQWGSDSHLTYLFNTNGENNLHMGGNRLDLNRREVEVESLAFS